MLLEEILMGGISWNVHTTDSDDRMYLWAVSLVVLEATHTLQIIRTRCLEYQMQLFVILSITYTTTLPPLSVLLAISLRDFENNS